MKSVTGNKSKQNIRHFKINNNIIDNEFYKAL